MLDRPLPHDLEAEQALLGSLLLADLDLDIRPDDFTREQHRIIARTVLGLRADGAPVDVLTVSDKLPQDYKPLILDLFSAVPTASNAAKYAEIVATHAKNRRLIQAASIIESAAYEGEDVDATALIEQADGDSAGVRSLADVQDARNPTLTQKRDYIRLQEWGVHIHYGDLTIVAARPSVGKSAFAGQLTDEFGQEGLKTRLYSLEMPAEDWYDRLIMRHTHFTTNDLDHGLTAEEAAFAVGATAEARSWPVEINDDATMSVGRLVADTRRFSRRGGKVCVTDYLGLLVSRERGDSFYAAVTDASKRLKVAARQSNVASFVLAQLSRKTVGESGAMRPPVLSDLRDSGAIEQDADNVILLHTYSDDDKKIREYLKEKGYLLEHDKDMGGRCMIASVDFAKMRRGPKRTFYAWWDAQDQRFFKMDSR